MSKMVLRKYKVAKHGDTWVNPNPSFPPIIFCPECASDEITTRVISENRWRGPFYILYTDTYYTCKSCNCVFTKRTKKKIKDVCWDDLAGLISLITLILFVLLAAIAYACWSEETLPLFMTITIISDCIVCLFSFIIWILN